jgi:hypothetical protein
MTIPLMRGASGAPARFAGWLRFVPIAEGSHSAHDGPVVDGPAGAARIYIIGDNPFENATPRGLMGQWVHVVGVWKNGVIRVEAGQIVVEAPPPQVVKAPPADPADPADATHKSGVQRDSDSPPWSAPAVDPLAAHASRGEAVSRVEAALVPPNQPVAPAESAGPGTLPHPSGSSGPGASSPGAAASASEAPPDGLRQGAHATEVA